MDTRETPRTNYAAYREHLPQTGDFEGTQERNAARWCNLLNEARKMERELQDLKCIKGLRSDNTKIGQSDEQPTK